MGEDPPASRGSCLRVEPCQLDVLVPLGGNVSPSIQLLQSERSWPEPTRSSSSRRWVVKERSATWLLLRVTLSLSPQVDSSSGHQDSGLDELRYGRMFTIKRTVQLVLMLCK